MTIRVQCPCGSTLQADDRFAGTRALCPYCRRPVVLTKPAPTKSAPPAEPLDVVEFLDEVSPPADAAARPAATSEGGRGTASDATHDPFVSASFKSAPYPHSATPPDRGPASSATSAFTRAAEPAAEPAEPSEPSEPLGRRMLQALLDPRAIQWLLMLGGGLMVLGLVIWLASLGIFKNPLVLAVLLGGASLGVHGAGCAVLLKTRHRTIGRALAFLGCVVLPLNLWYYQHQGILTVDQGLWMAAFVICWIFIGTVYALRDPLFIYAVEAGISLTALLFLGSLEYAGNATALSVTFLTLAILSIHGERSFPREAATFSRREFGLPLFWCGHLQLAAALSFLGLAQIIDVATESTEAMFGIHWKETLIADSRWAASAIWLAGMYLYIYSDLVVRRIGLYTYLAAVCLMMAEVTAVGWDLPLEWLIALMTLTAVAVNVALAWAGPNAERMRRSLPPLSLLVSFLAVALGCVLHLRATSDALADFNAKYETGWEFVIAMLIVAVGNRVSAFLDRKHSPIYATNYIFFSASGVLIGAAGILRNLEFVAWHQQAPILMVIPLVYLFVSLLRTERDVRGPLQWVAHAGTAVIVGSAVVGSLEVVDQVLRPVSGRIENLLAGLVFLEAMVFYVAAAVIRRRQINVYLATIAACLAIWQFMGYTALPDSYYTVLYASLGLALLIASRIMGLAERSIFNVAGEKSVEVTGPGASFYLAGNAVLLMAFVAAALQGIARVIAGTADWTHVIALSLTTLSGAIATCVVRPGPQRWWHATGTVALAGLTFLTFNVMIELPVWRKAEFFFVGIGLLLLVSSVVGRFRERQDQDLVTLGLWLGSAFAAITLLVSVLVQRVSTGPALPDELALVTVTILMLASGAGLQLKAPTLVGGTCLGLYLATIIVNLAYSPQVAIGVYLAIGGGLVFVVGAVLSFFRERLLAIPDKIAKREGVFRVMTWR